MNRGWIKFLVAPVSIVLASVGSAWAVHEEDTGPSRAFEMIDGNNDGFLTIDEFTRGARQGTENLRDQFRRLDDNRDDRVSRQELSDHWKAARDVIRPEFYSGENTVASARVQESAFVEIDRNRDDFLSRQEFETGAHIRAARARDVFERSDANNDGRISRAEFKNAWGSIQDARDNRRAARQESRQDVALARTQESSFKTLDTNRDDFVSLDEFRAGYDDTPNRSLRTFERLDVNNDARLSRIEFNSGWADIRQSLPNRSVEAVPAPAPAGEVLATPRGEAYHVAFVTLDKDQDGFVSLDEFKAGRNARAAYIGRHFLKYDDNHDGKLSEAELSKNWKNAKEMLRADIYKKSR